MFGKALAAAVGQHIGFEYGAELLEQAVLFGVVGVEQAGVVELAVDPLLEVVQFAEVDDKAIGVGRTTGKGQRNRPVVPVDEGAVPLMAVLAVRKRDIAVGFRTGKHLKKGVRLAAVFWVLAVLGAQLQSPVVRAEFCHAGCIACIGCWVGNAGQIEGFAALNTGAAAPAVQRFALVAGPGLREGHLQCCAAADDVGLGPVDEGTLEADRAPVTELHRACHGIGKLIAAIRIDRMVAAVGSVGHLSGTD